MLGLLWVRIEAVADWVAQTVWVGRPRDPSRFSLKEVRSQMERLEPFLGYCSPRLSW
jgi:hypothetical protein